MKFALHIFSLLLLVSQASLAQDFNINHYRAADGLQTDMIKSIHQDSLGFIWIGTDDGLIKYDGVKFTSYVNATTSNYIKDIYRTKSGRLLVLHDLGLVEINNQRHTVEFNVLQSGNPIISDTALWYPKSIFEDSEQNLWLSEPQSIVKLQADLKTWKRFTFDPKDNSSSFVRSFSYIQLNADSILISSFPGNYFIYNRLNDTIIEIKAEQQHETHVIKQINDYYYAGTADGLYEINLEGDVVKFQEPLLPVLVTDIELIDENTFVACSENSVNYIITRTDKMCERMPLNNSQLNTNQVYVGDAGAIWFSTQKGILLYSSPNFRNVKLDAPNIYVEAIAAHPQSNSIYLLSKEIVWEINKNTETSNRVYSESGAYLLSAVATENGIWLSNTFELAYLESGEIKYRLDLTKYGRFIFTLFQDSDKNIWIGQEATHGIKRFNPDTKELDIFGNESGLFRQVTAVGEDAEGMYVACSGSEDYLYFKPKNAESFVNISHKLPALNLPLNIEDIEIMSGSIWLATNQGLFCHAKDSVYKVRLNTQFEESFIKSMIVDGDFLWFGNQIGLYRYNTKTGDYNYFNESTGLPTNALNQEGILKANNKIWVGTPFGLSVMDYDSSQYQKTVKPAILNIKVDGSEFDKKSEALNFPYKAYIEFQYVSLSFPTNNIQYSYRIPELNKNWSVPEFSNIKIVTDIPSGDYSFEVRAKRIGNYQWSDIEKITFKVESSFYNSWKFYLLLVILVVVFSLITRSVTKYVMEQRQRILEQMVEERTAEIKRHERVLADSEERYKKLVESFPDIIMISDLNGNIIYGNEHLERITGITKDDFNNPDRKPRIYPDDVKKIVDARMNLLNSDKSRTEIIEHRFIDKWDNVHWLSGTMSKIYIQEKLYIQTVTRDITSRKEVELELEKHKNELEIIVAQRTSELKATNEELETTNEELYDKNRIINQQNIKLQSTLDNLQKAQAQLIQAEKMASLGVLTSGVAHEINNPLNFIMGGYVGLEDYLEESGQIDNEDVKELLNSIKDGMDRVTDIVNGLNQFSRTKQTIDEQCDIHAIIDNCLVMLKNKLKFRVEVEKHYSSENLVTIGNMGKLHQVFLNILTNASQAIEGEGKISIFTALKNDQVCIDFKDNGCGISEDNLKKITDPFFTTKDPGKGTGLGLSISYSIIEEHEGTMKFESKLNKGTTVKITIPKK